MRIAFVYDAIHPYVVGGVQKRNWEIATRLARRGHDVTLFGMKHWQGDDTISKDGVRLRGVCPPQTFFVGERRSIREAMVFACRVLTPLLGGRYDLIEIANFPYFPVFSAKLASLVKRARLVVTWHEVWDRYWYEYLGRLGLFGLLVERAAARLGARMVAVSEMTRRDLSRLARLDGLTVIPNGIDLAAVQRVAPSPEASDVIFAGRLIREKGVDLLLRAVGLLRRRDPDIRCTVVGDGPEMGALRGLTEGLGLTANVRFTGFLDSSEEVLARMKSSRLLALPSTREGFGIVALEANACGLPVVTVRHPRNAACDLVKDGENGYTARPSAEDLAEKLALVLEGDTGWRDRCVRAAAPFDWDAIASMAEACYLETASR